MSLRVFIAFPNLSPDSSFTRGPVTLGAETPLSAGNMISPTLTGVDALFALEPNARWDPDVNGGQGGIVDSNAPPGAESPRVVQVGLYVPSDYLLGASAVRFRRTAWVFAEALATQEDPDHGVRVGDITFRFLRFGSRECM